jgi:hypothetical protein
MSDEIKSVDQPTLDVQLDSDVPRGRRAPKKNGRAAVRAETAGEDLERRVARLEFSQGALARLRVPVRVPADPGRNVLTDLDVLSVDVDSRLRISRSILECKSGAGQAGEPDRLLWLSGLRTLLMNPRAVLVRQTVSTRGRDLARRLQIETMDMKRLSERETFARWLPERFAHVGGRECELAERKSDELLKGIPEVSSDLVGYLRHESVLNPGRALGVLTDLRLSVESVELPKPVDIVLAGHALVSLLLVALRDAQLLDLQSRTETETRIAQEMTVGGDPRVLDVLTQADAIMSVTVERVHQEYGGAGVRRREVPVPELRTLVTSPPLWITRYVDFLEAIRANASVGRELLQTAELACFEALVGGHAHEFEAFDHLFTVEHRQLLRLAILSLEEIAGPKIARPLNNLRSVSFDRVAPALSDRLGDPARASSDAKSDGATVTP